MTPHEVLGVPPGASDAVVRRAYRRHAAAAHPDAGGDPAQFRAVADAYLALTRRRRTATPTTFTRRLGYAGLATRWWRRRRDRVRNPRVV